jgi:hypothetical protein
MTTTAQSWAHPVDLLVREIARLKSNPGGDDVINLTAAIVNVAREQGTALGDIPPVELANLEPTGYFEHHPRAFGAST